MELKRLGDGAIRSFYMTLPRYDIDEGVKLATEFVQEAEDGIISQVVELLEDNTNLDGETGHTYIFGFDRIIEELKKQLEVK